jgi:hypothetical protein
MEFYSADIEMPMSGWNTLWFFRKDVHGQKASEKLERCERDGLIKG